MEWISVDDRLPDAFKETVCSKEFACRVLVYPGIPDDCLYYKSRGFVTTYFYEFDDKDDRPDRMHEFWRKCITHWMYYPEPPAKGIKRPNSQDHGVCDYE